MGKKRAAVKEHIEEKENPVKKRKIRNTKSDEKVKETKVDLKLKLKKSKEKDKTER